MNTEEQIKIMQAFVDGKPIQTRIRYKDEWIDDDNPEWDWSNREYRVKSINPFPSSWTEFCDAYPDISGWYYLDVDSDICKAHEGCKRNPTTDMAVVESRSTARAFRALMQLVTLRNCYNNGWVPDWKSYDDKYCICADCDSLTVDTRKHTHAVLAFNTAETRDLFFKNFEELLNMAKPLL